MTTNSTDSQDVPSQAVRDQFSKVIESNDQDAIRELLSNEPLLVNADLRTADKRDHFTNGQPLFRACQKNHFEAAKLLLEQGADPNATGSNPDDQPEFGLPLHFAAIDNRNFKLANLLFDHGASPNSYPYCSQSTIECMFYRAHEVGKTLDWNKILRIAYAKYLPEDPSIKETKLREIVANTESDPHATVDLFAKMVDEEGQLPFVALVRGEFNSLIMEILSHCTDAPGTRHDHPNSTVFNNIFGATRWYGYPKLHRQIIETYPERISYQSHLDTIKIAISSHNRDGDYQDYREIILMHLECLKSKSMLTQAQSDQEFKPIHKIATDFTWHDNYGYRAEIAKPECYIDLAALFVEWGFKDINFESPVTGHTPLSAAVKRGHHPGIATLVRWLLDHGADPNIDARDDVNPLQIAIANGNEEIRQLLEKATL